MASPSVRELVEVIKESTTTVLRHLEAQNLPLPSFDKDGPLETSIAAPGIEKSRVEAAAACLQLHDLLIGPAMCLRPIYNAGPLQVIYKYDIPSKVPLDGEVSFVELSEKCNLPEGDLRRLLRFAMVYHHVFQERRKGMVSHSAASRRLLEDPDALPTLGYMYDEMWQSYARTVEAMEKFRSHEPNETGWTVAQKTTQPAYDYYITYPDKGERFAHAMAAFTKGMGTSTKPIVQGYDWNALGSGGLVVDVGGSIGHVSIAVARAFPDLHCIVQELPDVAKKGKRLLPSDLADRVEFMEHDFFTPQPVTANVYFFRQIFHNWADEHAIRILQALIPALRPGAKVLCNDHCIPEPGTMPLMQERHIRAMDLNMLTIFNSRERERDDWERLFQSADARFSEVKVWTAEGANLAFIEATWSG